MPTEPAPEAPRAPGARRRAPSTGTRRLVGLLVLAQGALFATLGLARYATFHNETFDLAFYTRIAWGLARFDFWEPMVNAHVYGLHLSPILVPLGIVGRLGDTAVLLILAQASALALAAFPMARIGARHLGPAGALVGAVAWLFYPNLGHVAGYEVHPGAMAALPLAWLAWSLDVGDRRAFVASVVGVLLCREDLALITALSALLFGLRQRGVERDVRLAAVVGAASILYALFFFLVLHPRHAPAEGSLELHFGAFGSTPAEVALHLLSHPGELIAHLATRERLLYLPKVLGPLLFLPLLRPRWLVPTLPVLAINLLSAWPTTTQLDVQYLTPALPFLVAGALDGAGRLRRAAPLAAPAGLVAATIVGHGVAGGTPLSMDFPVGSYWPDANGVAAASIVGSIPPDASVQAPYPFLPHLAERPRLQRASVPEANAHYYVLDASVRRRFAGDEDLLRTLEEPTIRDWLARDDHRLVRADGDWLLLERGAHPRTGLGGRAIVGLADPASGRRIAACLAVRGARLDADLLTLELVARGPCPSDLAVRLGPAIRPERVDLLFGGWLNPRHLRRGDRVHSRHWLGPELGALVRRDGLRVGALRQSGARPEHADPVSVPVPLAP